MKKITILRYSIRIICPVLMAFVVAYYFTCVPPLHEYTHCYDTWTGEFLYYVRSNETCMWYNALVNESVPLYVRDPSTTDKCLCAILNPYTLEFGGNNGSCRL